MHGSPDNTHLYDRLLPFRAGRASTAGEPPQHPAAPATAGSTSPDWCPQLTAACLRYAAMQARTGRQRPPDLLVRGSLRRLP